MIKLRSLTKLFGPQVAVHGIDLDIPDGQLVGLLGPNGAGKSTTIKMLTGMLLPTSGTAEVGGFDVVQDPLNVKRIVGYVPETGAVFEALTGWEYLQLVAALYHIPEDEATERIQRFGQFFDLTIDTLQDKQLSAYSKGMRQNAFEVIWYVLAVELLMSGLLYRFLNRMIRNRPLTRTAL